MRRMMTPCKDVVTGRRVLYVDCSYNNACRELEREAEKEGFEFVPTGRYNGSLNHTFIKIKNPKTGEIREFIYDELSGLLLGERMD